MEIKVLKDILSANDRIAQRNRQLLDSHKIFAVNIMASPGAGKTSLIMETTKRLEGRVKPGVIEGDIASSIDAEAVGKMGVPVVQINTGGECHLDANMISNALGSLPLPEIQVLFIENVGNLVCPAEFALGEHLKVLIVHTPEGDDKPFKYPLMFHAVDAVIINKIDLLPYVKFNLEAYTKTVKSINSQVAIFPLSCTTGQGLDAWVAWLVEMASSLTR
ncbi:MAG: hydrogenase nickel incorporation protein HypB [Chloroflexi bacterium]|nr:hydrogenase nickel incorporation protein HypB [Chloroflexota bacterium]